MRKTRSRLLVTLALLALVGLCAWRQAQAGGLLRPSPGPTALTGSAFKQLGAQQCSGDPDSQGGKTPPYTHPNVVQVTRPEVFIPGWGHWSWVWLRGRGLLIHF
jgi:hypothetical protein